MRFLARVFQAFERVLLELPSSTLNAANSFANILEISLRRLLIFLESSIQFILDTTTRIARAVLEYLIRIIPILWRLAIAIFCIIVFLLPFLVMVRYGAELSWLPLQIIGWLCVCALMIVMIYELIESILKPSSDVENHVDTTDNQIYHTDLFRRFVHIDILIILVTFFYLYFTYGWFGLFKILKFLLLPLSNT